MGTLVKLFLLALAVGLASSKFTIPLSTGVSELCSTECTDGISNGNVLFAENTKYGYLFSANTKIIPSTGSEENVSEISIRGKVNVVGMQNCGVLLYLKQVEIIQGSKIHGHTELEGYPILISYNNGKINPTICSFEKDSFDSMNLKRSIASAFQVSLVQAGDVNIFETDNQGTCNTTYSTSSSDTFVVTKDKDLTKCTGHDKISLSELSSSQSNPVYKDSPFMSAIQHTEIQLKESMITSVSSQETFLYEPFGSSVGAVTKIMITMNLDLKKMSSVQSPSLPLNKRRYIGFEKPSPMAGLVDSDALVAATQLAMNNLQPIVKIDGAKNFANLIELLKVAKKDDIISAFQQIKSGTGFDDIEMSKTVFIDALITANNGESIEAVVELINNKELSDSLAFSWLSNLGNAKNPTKEALSAVSSLLNQKGLKDGYLGVGSLLNKYIMENQDYNSDEVQNTLKNLGAPLEMGSDGSLSSDDEDLTIASLKGLGNVQYINSDSEDLIVNIIMKKSALQRNRAAALNTAKVYAQNPKIEKACESIFTDITEDSELRLLAFKAFAIYPSNYKATVIKNMLDDKNCPLQIRAFLLSYLKNLQTTNDESKFEQKRFYEGIITKSTKNMPYDILRFSQNLEYSHRCPLLHSGVLFNGDIIFSYDSFLARSSSVSLKAMIFGRKYDVLNLDVRVENIEQALEKMWGPQGYFAKNNGNVINNVKSYITQAINYAKSRGINNLDSDISSKNDDENANENGVKKMYLDMAIDAFGKNLAWVSVHGLETEVTYEQIIDSILENFGNSISDKKNIELNINKQLSLMDYEKKYTTCSGLPISLKIQATTAIKLNIASKVDLQSYFNHPENSHLSLKVVPSGSFTLNSLLTVNGNSVEVGHKTTSSLHTATGSDFSLKTVKDHGFEVSYKVPLDDIDVISMKNEAFTIVQEKGSPLSETQLTTNVERQTYTYTYDGLSESLGFSFHVDYEFPWNGHMKSLLPFFGPSSFSLKFVKVDSRLTEYIVRGTYNFKSPMLNYVKFIFATPNSNYDRDVELVVAYDKHTHKTLVAELKTPSTKIVLKSQIVDTDEEKMLKMHYIDGSKHIFNIGVNCEKVDSVTMKYSPVFLAAYSTKENTNAIEKHPYLPIFDIEGHVLVKNNEDSENTYPSELTLKDISIVTPNSKHSMQGSVALENNELKGDLYLTVGRVVVNMNGYIYAYYPVYKMGGAIGMTKNENVGERSLLTDESDEYEPTSKLITLLYKINTLNILTAHELHVEQPYKFITNNNIDLDDDHTELNSNIVIDNGDFTMNGNFSTSNLLDLVLYCNMSVSPSTDDSGISVLGYVQHTYVTNPSLKGSSNMKYVQDKDKRGGYLELNSECPDILGVYHFNTQYQITDKSFKYNVNYDIQGNSILKANMDVMKDDITMNINLKCPNSDDTSSMILRGLLENEKTYSFGIKVVWPGSQHSNYLNADGKMILDGLSSQISGNIDFPAANLINFHTTIASIPDSENEDGGIASVRCISNGQTLLSDKFKYKLIMNNGELYVFGESIADESQNFIPIYFKLQYKNCIDKNGNSGKDIAYKIQLKNNGHMLIYQKSLKFTNKMLTYRQLYKIDDDEQKNTIDLEYFFIDCLHWSYKLKFKFFSADVFHFSINDNQNILEYNSYAIVDGYSLDKATTVNHYSSDGTLTNSHEFRWFINNKKSTLKIMFGQREIRGLCHYSLTSIKEGYKLNYSGVLWLDYVRDSKSKSSISINSQYSLENGLSALKEISILVPSFNKKEMSFKSDIQIFESWENPVSVTIDLNIFPTVEQTLQLHTSLNRMVKDNGVLYSAELSAISDGMQLEYLVKESLFVSKDKWGKYLEGYFIDSDNIKRPIELNFDLVPHGFNTKVNIFNIAVISVASFINSKDDALSTYLTVTYNDNPYLIGLSFDANSNIKYTMKWNDKREGPKQLEVEGSITMDESAIISATLITNEGKDIKPIGYVKKSLEKQSWWNTENTISSEQWNPILKSLKQQIIERFINVHNNTKNIVSIVKQQRLLRLHEARMAKSQCRTFFEYSNKELNQLYDDIREDEYIQEIPCLIKNYIQFINIGSIDFINYINLIEFGTINWSMDINIDLSNIYGYYADQIDLVLKRIESGYKQMAHETELILTDLLYITNQYTDKPVNEMSTEPHSLNDYLKDLMNKCIYMIKELKDSIKEIQKISEDYIKNLPLYSVLQDNIDMIKSYPYKDILSEKIDKHLQEIQSQAPTKDFAGFVKALRMYIHNTMYDIPIHEKDLIDLRRKGIIVIKSFLFNFSEYVSYDSAMAFYGALSKITNFSKNVLYMISPDNQYQNPGGDQNMLIDLSEYIQKYQNYLNPTNLLPPYDGIAVLIDSTYIITYNGKPYNFMPYDGCYLLATDFVNKKFSIFANYKDNVLTSISVLSGNDETYSLLPGGSITVNDKNVDFPLIRENVKTSKDFAFFEINLDVGVIIKCTLELDIVVVCINGYYFGQVKGLLGSMNNEPMFDLIPNLNISNGINYNGKPSNDMQPFLMAYRISGDTEPTNIDLVQTHEPLSRSLFSGSSAFKSVFPIVSPTPYRAICNQIIFSATSQEDSLNKACLVAKAYVMMARQHYVMNCNIPDQCTTTMVDKQMISSTTNVQRSIQSNVVDVMILFEQSEQNKELFSELLEPFIKTTNTYFGNKYLSDIQYTIIGYSGKPTDSDVNIYTYNENNIDGLLSNVPEWTQSEPTSQFVQSFKNVLGDSSKIKAYKLSANYPFRPNAFKVVISVAQTLYTESIKGVSSFTFDYVSSSYAAQGIKFFLIAPVNLKHPSDDEIFGLGGANTVYTWSSLKGKPSDEDYTYDKCLETGLVTKTNGAMYNSISYVDGTNVQKTNFLKSLSKTIVDTSTSTRDSTVMQSCSSSVYNGVKAFPKCVLVMS